MNTTISSLSKYNYTENYEKNDYIIEINNPNSNSKKYKKFIKKNKNFISTSKYRWFNCIPKIIIEQFLKLSNIYFLVIAIFQSIKEISNSNGRPVILMPLLVVILINGTKNFLEDLKRKHSDDKENTRNIFIYSNQNKNFVLKQWKNIKIGDIIKIKKNEIIPCDCIFLYNENNKQKISNEAFVETKNLDGETNLKFKKGIFNKPFDFNNLSGKIITNSSNEKLYEFKAIANFLNINDDKDIIINNDNFLLRGCILKQIEYVYAISVYCGHNTKIMKNSTKSRNKVSKVEKFMNTQIIYIFIFQIFLSIIAALFSYFELRSIKIKKFSLNKKLIPYIYKDLKLDFKFIIIKIFTWNVLLNNLVPISLLMTMELIKYFQGCFIQWDINIYDRETKNKAKVQTSTLNEELGQVEYLFTDKTGTITKNYLNFCKLCIGKKNYGNNFKTKLMTTNEDEFGSINNVNFEDNNFENDLKNCENFSEIDLFLSCLALCHNSFINNELKKEKNIIEYLSSSPDEIALLNFARNFKYIFFGTEDNNLLLLKNNVLMQYKKLLLIDFTSERKRLSIIVKDLKYNKYFLFIKGADNVIIPKLINKESNKILFEYLNNYANEGLRTLLIGYKQLDENIVSNYLNKINIAKNKYLNLDLIYDEIENNINLLGITGINDELQDEVPEVLNDFIEAGIKIWMLTGDKKETAKSISYSCNLINNKYTIFEFNEEENIKNQLINFIQQFNKIKSLNLTNNKFSLIISEIELNKIINSFELKLLFYLLSTNCTTVICCRVSPKQKARMVRLVKRFSKKKIVTLAIGDGANDVNMINTANIGVGIIGKEGLAAVRASDYSIGQFKFLHRIILFYGREFYRKNSFCIIYNFYKNFLFVIPQFILGFDSLFSGQTIYDPFLYQMFNILFSSLPIIFYTVYDKEISSLKVDYKKKWIKYYVDGLVDKYFNFKQFWKWIFYGLFQSFIIYIIIFKINLNGDLILNGTKIYSAIILIVNLKIMFKINNHTIISLFIFIISNSIYYVFVYFLSKNKKNFIFGNFDNFFYCINYYLEIIIILVICFLNDIGLKLMFSFCGCLKKRRKLNRKKLINNVDLDENKIHLKYQSEFQLVKNIILNNDYNNYNDYIKETNNIKFEDNKNINSINNENIKNIKKKKNIELLIENENS